MSIQFGIWQINGNTLGSQFNEANSIISRYAADDRRTYTDHGIAISYYAFHSTRESRSEVQPHLSPSGCVIVWDGRLDNRDQLLSDVAGRLPQPSSDVEIVANAYDRWGSESFSRLLGDWAMSIWNPATQTLTLARDFMGVRKLYYVADGAAIKWCTVLDPLLLLQRTTLTLNEEYIAGWLGSYPAANLTPYMGIYSVPPSCSVALGPGKAVVRKYWDFDPGKRHDAKNDGEYEEAFLTLFRQSVRRRLRGDYRILAELSGGMDSSSIVCIADSLIRDAGCEATDLNTVSFLSDCEPSSNERPYIDKVEAQRRQSGHHIDCGLQHLFDFFPDPRRLDAVPVRMAQDAAVANQFAALVRANGYRTVLSGIGGDEVLGGVPTATPQLQDLFRSGRFRGFASQLGMWALAARRPWVHLFWEALRGFLSGPSTKNVPTWLAPSFVHRNHSALIGYEKRLRLFGPRPSFQHNLFVVEHLRRQLSSNNNNWDPPFERRYPYLDRDLLEYLCSIPREQLLRPGERRSLMRRALRGLVPDEVIGRKRKGFVSRGPRVAIERERVALSSLTEGMLSSSLGIIDEQLFVKSWRDAPHDPRVPMVFVVRTVYLEMWLRQLRQAELVKGSRELLSPRWACIPAQNLS